MPDIFISYKRSERKFIERIYGLLKDQSLDVWFDSNLNIGEGSGFDAEINARLAEAKCVLVCWTPEAARSVFVRGEALNGLERGILVPIKLVNCHLPVPFNAINTVNLSAWNGSGADPGWKQVLERVMHLVRRPETAPLNKEIAAAIQAYLQLPQKIYPGLISQLVPRIATLREADFADYHEDVVATDVGRCDLRQGESIARTSFG